MVREQTVMLELQEKDRQEFRKKQIENIISYRKDHQTFQSRREFDLNDPESLKKGLPARVRVEWFFYYPIIFIISYIN